jgi:hypothetical protein
MFCACLERRLQPVCHTLTTPGSQWEAQLPKFPPGTMPGSWVFRFVQAATWVLWDWFQHPSEAASKFRINIWGSLLHKCILPLKLLSETVKPTYIKQFLHTLIILNSKTRESQTALLAVMPFKVHFSQRGLTVQTFCNGTPRGSYLYPHLPGQFPVPFILSRSLWLLNLEPQ